MVGGRFFRLHRRRDAIKQQVVHRTGHRLPDLFLCRSLAAWLSGIRTRRPGWHDGPTAMDLPRPDAAWPYSSSPSDRIAFADPPAALSLGRHDVVRR